MTDKNPIVVMKGITIEFPGVKALDGVDLTLYPGEVHALMGENGAGKSTMIKALTGVYKINAGSIMVDGKPQQFNGTLDAQNAGIATVYQEVNLCTNLSVGENVMLGHEKRGPFGIDWKKTHEAAKKYLAQMGLESIDPHTPLSSISIAMQQLVAIARAMVINAKVLILDEPTSSLDANEVRDLFAIMRKVRDSGVAILFVSHFLDQIYEITDRLTILRNGQFIKEVMTKDTPRDELIGMMIGKSAAELSQIGAKKARREITPGEKPIVDVKGLGKKGTINPVDVDIYKGEVVGFAGLLGSGRTELGRLLYGADKPDSGTYTLNGKKVNISDPYTALKNKIAYSTENRRDEGIIGDLQNLKTRSTVDSEKMGYLGITCQDVTSEIAQQYDMPEGIYLKSVVSGCAADKAGLKKGDILTRFDGVSVTTYDSLRGRLQYYEAGETVEVTVQSPEDGSYEEKTVTLTLSTKAEVEAANQ